MSAKDIVATIGTYLKDGETKYVNRKVGALVETKHGPKIKLDASFNPAGCIREDDGGVWLAIFDQRERDDGGQPRGDRNKTPGGRSSRDDFNDDLM